MYIYLADKLFNLNDQVSLAEFGFSGSQIQIFRELFATKTDANTAVLSDSIYVFNMNRNFPTKLFR